MSEPKDTRSIAERRQAVLAQIRKALDAFYTLQRIDWDFDIQETLEKIVELAMQELRISGDLDVTRAMIVIQREDHSLACHGGWFSENQAVRYSNTVVAEVLETGQPMVVTDSRSDNRFESSHSVRIKRLESFVCLPIEIQGQRVGAFFVDTSSSDRAIEDDDVAFIGEFISIISPYLAKALVHYLHFEELSKRPPVFCGLIGRSARMQQLFDQIRLLGQTDATVLVHGETGTGKELVARAIHQVSERASGPFVAVACAALPGEELERELFGSLQTGDETAGAADRADGGVLFLDEVAEISADVQARLLQFLQDQTFRPVGGDRARRVDCRVIAATHQDLRKRVDEGAFREDLYYRMNVLPIQVPALRERTDDLPDLLDHFLGEFNDSNERTVSEVTPEAMAALRRFAWDGNVRQLQHTVQHAALFARGGQLRLEDLPEEVRTAGPTEAELTFQQTLEDVRRERGESGEKEYIERALDRVKDVAMGRVDLVERTVELIPECSASTLRRRIKLLDIDLARFAAKQTGRRR